MYKPHKDFRTFNFGSGINTSFLLPLSYYSNQRSIFLLFPAKVENYLTKMKKNVFTDKKSTKLVPQKSTTNEQKQIILVPQPLIIDNRTKTLS